LRKTHHHQSPTDEPGASTSAKERGAITARRREKVAKNNT
jgi:hypothetical protein